MHDPTLTLAANLAALRRRDRALALRLAAPVSALHLRVEGAQWSQKRGNGWQRIDLDRSLVESAVRGPVEQGVVILGIGAGELVEHALRTGVPRVYAWEADPWCLRVALMHNDWSEALLDGRLRLALGADLLRLERNLPRWEHPIAKHVHAREIAVFDHPGERALIVDGGLVVDDLVRALARTGVAAWTLFAERDSVEELDHTLRTVGARRVYSINYVEGLAEFAEERGLELYVWEIDAATAPPRRVQRELPNTHVFCHRRANQADWRAAGYQHVAYLPLAADPERRRPLEEHDPRYRTSLAFVGSSQAANADVSAARFVDGLVRGHGLRPELAEVVLEELVARQVAEPEHFLLPAAWAASPFGDDLAPFHGEDPVMLVAEVAASRARLDDAAALIDAGLAVWGDEGWERVPGLDVRGPAGHNHELARVYAGADLVLDLPRLYQRDIVTLRVFDALAMERPVLTPLNPALVELFEPGRELLAYRDRRDALRLAQSTSPDALQELARRGRARVLAEHTFDHRLAAMHRAALRVAA